MARIFDGLLPVASHDQRGDAGDDLDDPPVPVHRRSCLNHSLVGALHPEKQAVSRASPIVTGVRLVPGIWAKGGMRGALAGFATAGGWLYCGSRLPRA